MRFRDRADAGRRLAAAVTEAGLDRPIVLALPRGGVPVAAPVADALGAPLEVLVARKVGAPGQPELGIGAIAEGGGVAVNERVVRAMGLGSDDLQRLAAQEMAELERRVERYRLGRGWPELAGREVVLVDDGLATGVTAEAALRSLRAAGAGRIVLAVPVAAASTGDRLRELAEVVTLVSSDDLQSVGEWYRDFAQTSDEEVVDLLADRHPGLGPRRGS